MIFPQLQNNIQGILKNEKINYFINWHFEFQYFCSR